MDIHTSQRLKAIIDNVVEAVPTGESWLGGVNDILAACSNGHFSIAGFRYGCDRPITSVACPKWIIGQHRQTLTCGILKQLELITRCRRRHLNHDSCRINPIHDIDELVTTIGFVGWRIEDGSTVWSNRYLTADTANTRQGNPTFSVIVRPERIVGEHFEFVNLAIGWNLKSV